MKTKKMQLIAILLCLCAQVSYSQDTLSTRVSTSYEAETYYLYNKASSKGRLGGVAANSEGITTWSNSSPIKFAFNGTHNYFLSISHHGEDALIYAEKFNKWLRMGGSGGLALWGNGKYESSIPNLFINNMGNVGINNATPAVKLHVLGDILLEKPSGSLGSFFRMRNTLTSTMDFEITLDAQKTGYWLGTSTNHQLSLGVNGKSCVTFHNGGHAVFYRTGTPINIKISQANMDKYAVFVLGGILSEDYAIGPKESWADHVFDENYELKGLSEIESFIKENKHLPDIPSAEQVNREGYSLHDMNVKLLQKVEELTLYSISQSKEINQLRQEMETYRLLSQKIEEMEKKLNQ